MTDADRIMPSVEQLERDIRTVADGITDPGHWRALVRWMAPELSRTNPKLLAEIVVRRALKRATDNRAWSNTVEIDTAEMIATEIGMAGLKLAPA